MNEKPIMNDKGRGITEFKPPNRIDGYIGYINNIYRDDEYRHYLQNNSKKIRDSEWMYIRNKNYYWPNVCIHDKFPQRPTLLQMAQQKQLYDDIAKYGAKNVKGLKCPEKYDYRL